MESIITQQVYFVNNCATLEQVEELERNYIRNYGDKVPDALEMEISNKKVILKSDLAVKEIATEKYLNENK